MGTKTVREMTYQERQDEIARIRNEEAQVLKTPLFSEGSLSSTQWSRMGKAARAKLTRNGDRRLQLEARLRELGKSDETLALEADAAAKRALAEKRARLERDIRLCRQFATPNKAGKISKAYAREIAAAEAKLAALLAGEAS